MNPAKPKERLRNGTFMDLSSGGQDKSSAKGSRIESTAQCPLLAKADIL